MKIVPVIDLMGGHVVRGIAGRRHEYRPIASRLTASPEPLAVAQAFRNHFGLNELYLADLDALAGGRPCLEIYAALRSGGFQLWVDAGIREADDATPLAEVGIERLVAGLETVAGPRVLESLCKTFGPRIVFSLDLKDGQPLAGFNDWGATMPFDIARLSIDLGVATILVLDLRRVGTGAGTGTEDLCRRLSESFPKLELAAGGGVRSVADLRCLQNCGVHVALVASALHDGAIAPADWSFARAGSDNGHQVQ